MKCLYTESCSRSVLDARDSAKMSLIGCSIGDWSCFSMTIWCPPNINGEKKCSIEGDSTGFAGDYGNEITLYAVNSWNDIDFKTVANGYSYYYGKMYCLTDYSEYCQIDRTGP